MNPQVGDTLQFDGISYEIIKMHGEEDGPPKGQIDVGRRSPDDFRGIGLALTIDFIVWDDLKRLSQREDGP